MKTPVEENFIEFHRILGLHFFKELFCATDCFYIYPFQNNSLLYLKAWAELFDIKLK